MQNCSKEGLNSISSITRMHIMNEPLHSTMINTCHPDAILVMIIAASTTSRNLFFLQ